MESDRITAPEIRRRLLDGEPVLLVCAYEEDSKFETVALEGAIPFSEFVRRRPSLPAGQEIVFY